MSSESIHFPIVEAGGNDTFSRGFMYGLYCGGVGHDVWLRRLKKEELERIGELFLILQETRSDEVRWKKDLKEEFEELAQLLKSATYYAEKGKLSKSWDFVRKMGRRIDKVIDHIHYEICRPIKRHRKEKESPP